MNVVAIGLAGSLGWGLGAAVNRLARRLPGWLGRERAGDRPPSAWRERGIAAATAVCCALLWLRYGLTPALVWATAVTLLLMLVAAIDIDRRLVFDKVLVVGVALAGVRVAGAGWAALPSTLLAGGVGFAIFAVLAVAQRGALGAGDVKLAGVLGLLLGYPAALTALLLGVLCGGATAAVLLLTRRLGRRAFMPYAPFLAVGGIATLLLTLPI